MNVPQIIRFKIENGAVEAVVDFKLRAGLNGVGGATFGVQLADYDTTGAAVGAVLTEIAEFAQQTSDKFDATYPELANEAD